MFPFKFIERYTDRKETDIAKEFIKQIIHFFSDTTIPAGLPVPCMVLFNLMQFGSIGEEEVAIAGIVQGMYFEGYGFAHFCSMSIPVAVSELFVRFACILRKLNEGVALKEAVSLSTDRQKNPKLPTMLLMAHSSAAVINVGKIYFSKNPMAINYPQWISFAKYSYKQLRWVLIEKPDARDRYVKGVIDGKLEDVYADIDRAFEELGTATIVV